MNLFIKSYRVHLIFFLLITCETCINRGFAQAYDLQWSPWIQEINLPARYREIPNETFFRSPHGTLFIGKANGLNIIHEGHSSYFHMQGPVYVNGNSSDTLFYASRNDLGYLIRQMDGSFRLVSRVYLLPASQRSFTPRGMEMHPGFTYIFTDTNCLQFSGSEVKYLDKNTQREMLRADTVSDNEIKALVGNKTGISAAEIKQIFHWNKSEIWILGAHSLHMIYNPSPLNMLDLEPVPAGRILSSMLFGNRILLGTGHGLYMVSKDAVKEDRWTMLSLLPETAYSIHLLSSAGNQVYAAGSDGLFVLRENHAERIDMGSFTGILALRNGNVVASDREGIIRYRPGRDGWESTIIDNRLAHSHSFTPYHDQSFFLCDNGIYTINDRADKITPVSFQPDELLYALQEVGSSLYLTGSQKVYRYDENEEVFHPLPAGHLMDLLFRTDKIISAGSNTFWSLENSGDHFPRIFLVNNPDEATCNTTSFPVLNHLGAITNIAYADSVLFLTGSDKIFSFDLRRIQEGSGKVSIKVKEPDTPATTKGFMISGFELQGFPEPLFRYRILPRDTLWSEWDPGREPVISGLRQGKYTLEVQSKDLFGRIAEAEPMPYSVPPPFFASWYAYLVYVVLGLALLVLIRKWLLLSLQRAESRIAERMENKIRSLAAEKEKSDRLVAEMLPEITANQIISKGKARWDKYERATVLFSDIQGFTRIAEEMNPEKLIDELDSFFFHFDSVVEKYNIEKIKTIGDAYMAAGGIPNRNSTNPVEVVMAALEIQAYMQQLKSTRARIWDLRIGIHTGPVIAGVVGHKKISYDIWGDTVNTASRMESSGAPGKINISGITYGMVKDYFLCEYRGKLPVKYKGNIDMYFVNGLRPELAIDLKGIPNKRFYMQLQLLRLADLEEKVFTDILNKLPETLHFHRPEYLRKVYNQSYLLCRSEEIEEDGRLLARTAALMLFTGLSQTYHNFENRSAVICREILPGFAYSDDQIDQICNLILATKRPFDPKNRLEKILIDARMEYIGRPDFTSQSKLLYKELKEAGSKINGQQFKKQQQELLYEFSYYTTAAQRLREVSRSDQMTTLEQERWI